LNVQQNDFDKVYRATMKRTIFLSYSSPRSEAATRIELSLKGEGHSVFRDRSALPPGESFDARILAAIEESDLFIFLISRESILDGRYTLTELKFAEQSGDTRLVMFSPC
jgi:TIR domain